MKIMTLITVSSLSPSASKPVDSEAIYTRDSVSESVAEKYTASILHRNNTLLSSKIDEILEKAVTQQPVSTTTDIYSRALQLVERKRQRSQRPKNYTTSSFARPRVTQVRAKYRSEVVAEIRDANSANITKRKDDTVSEEEIQNMTDTMANLTLENGSGRASGGRAIDSFSSFFNKFTKVLDLGRVVREIETSVMTSVSCTACRAGKIYICSLDS